MVRAWGSIGHLFGLGLGRHGVRSPDRVTVGLNRGYGPRTRVPLNDPDPRRSVFFSVGGPRSLFESSTSTDYRELASRARLRFSRRAP